MKLTTFTDYGLRVLMHLATIGGRCTIAEIARAHRVSEHHLVKIVHFLGKRGWLANVRGKGGGLQLARPPEAINIGDVVRASESATLLAECFRGDASSCALAPCCRARAVLAEAVAAFYASLDRYTLADLVTNRSELATVLFTPRAAPARSAA